MCSEVFAFLRSPRVSVFKGLEMGVCECRVYCTQFQFCRMIGVLAMDAGDYYVTVKMC